MNRTMNQCWVTTSACTEPIRARASVNPAAYSGGAIRPGVQELPCEAAPTARNGPSRLSYRFPIVGHSVEYRTLEST